MRKEVRSKSKTPREWALAIASVQGNKDAHRIAEYYSRPMIGKDNSDPNPHSAFYLEALNWMKKHLPRREE